MPVTAEPKARKPPTGVLCGGDISNLEQAGRCWGDRRVDPPFRAVGSGQQVKAINQVLVAGSYAAVAEAIA